jgi:hypothetical protein
MGGAWKWCYTTSGFSITPTPQFSIRRQYEARNGIDGDDKPANMMMIAWGSVCASGRACSNAGNSVIREVVDTRIFTRWPVQSSLETPTPIFHRTPDRPHGPAVTAMWSELPAARRTRITSAVHPADFNDTQSKVAR